MWLKQTSEKRLYPDLEWEKPERKDQAGRLLIIGGNLHGFAAPARAFEIANEQGIGSTRIIMPDSLKRTLGPLWTDAIFTESTPSGSFALKSKDLILQNIMWADGVLLAGDTGRNSETAIMLEEIIKSTNISVAITKDALDYFTQNPDVLLFREKTIIVGSFAQIQKMLARAVKPTVITHSMQLNNIVEALQKSSAEYKAAIVTRINNTFIVAYDGTVSTTHVSSESDIWRVATAARCAVNVLHYPLKIFESLTDAVYKAIS